MADVDPFTQAYQRLVEALTKHKGVADLVLVGNRTDYLGSASSAQDPERDQAQDADKPELLIEPYGGSLYPRRTSSSSAAVQSFQLRVATTDLRVRLSYFPLKWQILRALARVGIDLGLPFVKDVRVEDVVETKESKDANRGTPGWAMLCVIHVHCYWNTSELIGD